MTVDTDQPPAIIIPSGSTGSIQETRAEFSWAHSDPGGNASVGIVYGFQDINNFTAVALLYGYDSDDIKELGVFETVNGNITEVASSQEDSGFVPANEWVDVRIQAYRSSNSETTFTAALASHGDSYQPYTQITVSDSNLSFTSGDVGICAGGHKIAEFGKVGIDGDPIGSGGRPIRMYWP